jgi:hypothetical protein
MKGKNEYLKQKQKRHTKSNRLRPSEVRQQAATRLQSHFSSYPKPSVHKYINPLSHSLSSKSPQYAHAI